MVSTKEFSNKSFISNKIQALLKAIILPLSEPHMRPAYRQQFDQASRNAEILLERLGHLSIRHPIKAATVLKAIYDWQSSYFGAQKDTKDGRLYDVYTKKDRAIPFKPKEDIMYTYMLAQLAIVADEIASIINTAEMRNLVDGFMALNSIATEAFHQYPTVMPRYKQHDRVSLRIIQRLDEPLNCCPSLHIAYSIYLDNIAEDIILNRAGRKDVFEGIRYSTLRMFNSVLYTKQHALIDVAYGMLCAKIMYEDRYPRVFNDLADQFDRLQLEHPSIDYQQIHDFYKQGLIYLEQDGLSFTQALAKALEAGQFPVISMAESQTQN